MNFFNKAVVFTDLHFGKKNNDREHNIDCVNFIKWTIEEAKKFGADTIICMGDWSDNRRNLHVSTMNYSLYCMELLARDFKFYLINGNHDLYYRQKREINSVEFGRNIPNCFLIKEPLIQGDVALIPWLVEEEYKAVPDIKTKYMFGHFELGGFLMNAMVEMPESGHLTGNSFANQEYVFSGHFHKRQFKKNKNGVNIVYIGNAFPHNYSDAWDEDRGIMLLDWGKEPVFKAWPGQPTYRSMKLSQFLEHYDMYALPNSSAKVTVDTKLSYEEIAFLKETFVTQFKMRDLTVLPMSTEDSTQDIEFNSEFQSIDQIVIEGLQNLDTSSVDANILIDIYRNL